jgi:hypothetical protein
MPRPLRAALAVVLALGTASRPVVACCEDFWTCTAAVATGGLTCAIEAALNAVRTLIQMVRTVRDQTSQKYLAGLTATTDEMKAELARLETEIKAAIQEIEKARNEADRIFHEDAERIRTNLAEAKVRALSSSSLPKGSPSASTGVQGAVTQNKPVRAAIASVAPTPTRPPAASLMRPPSAAGTMPPAESVSKSAAALELSALTALQSDDSLQTLRHRIELLRQRKQALVAAIAKVEADLTARQFKAAEEARSAFATSFLKPVDDLLASLTATLSNPLNAPGVVSSALALLDSALNGLHATADLAAEEAARIAEKAVAQKIPPAQEMRKISDEARKTLAAMRKAASFRVAYDRQTVVKGLGTLPASTPSPVAQAVRLRASAALRETSKTVGSRFTSLKPEVQKLSQVKRTFDVSSFRPRLGGDFDGFFRGKSPADGKRKLGELTAEARRRFASDPKTLAAVEKLLNDEARARGVPP